MKCSNISNKSFSQREVKLSRQLAWTEFYPARFTLKPKEG